MSFQYSAIGDNTIENREHLEKLGYTISMVTMDKAIYLKTQANRKYYETNNDDWSKVITNCIGNTLLFQAVTAIRDDSDMYQWFVSDEDIFTKDGDDIVVSKGDFILSKEVYFIDKYHDYPREAHKATLAELQEHFK
ncbi:hypothetical protein [uncultured Dysgonomonas sp.]|uniref:Uncharacterized protein n=1 Tax=uncultured Dysgonomonas sp. TaxID=206096 RepID=A0A212IXD8_9BACT|nr:hypothetical protein [uncultured Dysgonomonas sp.]SBV91837.1 conserved hypothetical protein [uncultured Dysgonomonas sp.]